MTKDDFIEIVANAVQPVHFSIEQYLLFQYNNYKSVNPDFVSNLKTTIDSITSNVDFYASLSVDYPKDYKWHEHLIYYEGHSFKVLEYDFNIRETALDNKIADLYRDGYAPTTINELRRSFNQFKTLIKNDVINEAETKDAVISDMIQLHWKGQNNQLYSVIRQIKLEQNFIDDSFDTIAKFLKQSFTNFASTKLSTIEKELKKDTNNPQNLAKNKRVHLRF